MYVFTVRVRVTELLRNGRTDFYVVCAIKLIRERIGFTIRSDMKCFSRTRNGLTDFFFFLNRKTSVGSANTIDMNIRLTACKRYYVEMTYACPWFHSVRCYNFITRRTLQPHVVFQINAVCTNALSARANVTCCIYTHVMIKIQFPYANQLIRGTSHARVYVINHSRGYTKCLKLCERDITCATLHHNIHDVVAPMFQRS
jgi:hypothetical protein